MSENTKISSLVSNITDTTLVKYSFDGKKTVTLTLDAYNFLVSKGGKNQTFSEIVLSLKDAQK